MTTLGILGGGQLGMMLSTAARALGVDARCYDPSADACAARVGPLSVGAFDDIASILQFAERCDCITIEFEKVPVPTIEALIQEGHRVMPGPQSLRIAQDRILEKELFNSIDLPVPPYQAIDSLNDLQSGIERIGLPAVLKTRRDGYDGKGQFVIRRVEQAEEAWQAVRGAPCILETMVDFRRELSVVTARDQFGTIRSFVPTENVHLGGILHRSVAPAREPGRAVEHAERLVAELDHIGVLTLELFEAADGTLLGNEYAPRVHNSGHWTMDAGSTDQFSQHVRAVCGLKLESPELEGGASMINLIGQIPPEEALDAPGLRSHLYGKDARPGRKLGHMNWNAENDSSARALADDWAGQWLKGQRAPADRATPQR